eukprot:440458_1
MTNVHCITTVLMLLIVCHAIMIQQAMDSSQHTRISDSSAHAPQIQSPSSGVSGGRHASTNNSDTHTERSQMIESDSLQMCQRSFKKNYLKSLVKEALSIIIRW